MTILMDKLACVREDSEVHAGRQVIVACVPVMSLMDDDEDKDDELDDWDDDDEDDDDWDDDDEDDDDWDDDDEL